MRHALLILLAGACSGDLKVNAKLRSANTIQLTWDTFKEGVSWVEYGEDLEHVTPPREGKEHRFVLAGNPPFTEIHFQAYTEIEGELRSAEGYVTTGGLPSSLPELTVTTYEPDLVGEAPYILGGTFGKPRSSVYAINYEGDWLWYHQSQEDLYLIELQLEERGNGFFFNTFALEGEDQGALHQRDFTGRISADLRTPLGHHSFEQLPDGRIAYIGLEVQEHTDSDGVTQDVVADTIEIMGEDREEITRLFSIWDYMEPEPDEEFGREFYDLGADWTHGNKLTYRESSDTLLLSLANINTILEIDASTGEVVRELGGDGWGFTEGSAPFDFQHDPSWTDAGTLLMTSVIETEGTTETIAVEYALDEEQELLDEIWSYGRGEGIHSQVEGMARELPNGNRRISWGYAGLMREVTPEGELAWEIQTSAGAAFGYSTPFEDFYDTAP